MLNIVFEFLLASKCFCESNLFSRKDYQFCNFQVNVVLPQATVRIFYFFRDDLLSKAVSLDSKNIKRKGSHRAYSFARLTTDTRPGNFLTRVTVETKYARMMVIRC